jgi:CRP/FNR family transcriptional regulator, nitrogen fixation regulation protein
MFKIVDTHTPTNSALTSTLWSNFKYRRGTEIFGEAEPADCVYQIRSGAVRTFKLLSDGRRQIGAFHLPGDIFGIESGDAYRSTAEAIIDTQIRITKRERIFAEFLETGALRNDVLKLLTRNLEHAENQVLLLGRQTAVERVAAFLTEMDRRLQSPETLILPMSRRDIADYLGLTHETVSRGFAILIRAGAVSFPRASHREIVVHNRTELARLAFLPEEPLKFLPEDPLR